MTESPPPRPSPLPLPLPSKQNSAPIQSKFLLFSMLFFKSLTPSRGLDLSDTLLDLRCPNSFYCTRDKVTKTFFLLLLFFFSLRAAFFVTLRLRRHSFILKRLFFFSSAVDFESLASLKRRQRLPVTRKRCFSSICAHSKKKTKNNKTKTNKNPTRFRIVSVKTVCTSLLVGGKRLYEHVMFV